MLFASPLWLIALLPWAGATLWLLWGRRKRTPVPFLELWRGPALQKPANRALQPPPIFLAFALAAMGLALIAAAHPRIPVQRAGKTTPITIIVDHGMTMSATARGVPRFQIAAKAAGDALTPLLSSDSPVSLLVLPGKSAQPASAGGWTQSIASLSPTAVDTQASLEEAVRDSLSGKNVPVVIISDRRLAFDDPRLIQFSPDAPIDNVGIVRLAARETPAAQVMVRLRNDSDRRTVALKVTSGSNVIAKSADLPGRGRERDYFFDFPRLQDRIDATLEIQDDQSADNQAWLLREGSYPKIEPRAPLSPELRRVIDVFTRLHPPTENSRTVSIVSAESDMPADAPAIIVAPAVSPRPGGSISARSDPIAANVDWPALPADLRVVGDFPRNWTPTLSIGDRVIVATQTDSVRRVWVGFDAPSWSATSDFVVFWANVFMWTGQGQERFASYPLTAFDGMWKPLNPPTVRPAPAAGEWPGVYQGPEGALRVFHAPDTRPEHAHTTPDWRQRLESALGPENAGQSGYDVTSPMLVVAILCLTAAAMTWKRPGAMANPQLPPIAANQRK